MDRLKVLGAALALAGAASCVSGSLTGQRVHRSPDEGAVASLTPGVGLDTCLARLGAPLFVDELGESMALSWGWFDGSGWGVGVSVPVGEHANASLDYDDIDDRMRGAVLFFDERWVLTEIRLGYLRDLAEVLVQRRRPQLVEPDSDSDDVDEGP